jgi:hypothetical protein
MAAFHGCGSEKMDKHRTTQWFRTATWCRSYRVGSFVGVGRSGPAGRVFRPSIVSLEAGGVFTETILAPTFDSTNSDVETAMSKTPETMMAMKKRSIRENVPDATPVPAWLSGFCVRRRVQLVRQANAVLA